MDAAEPLLAVRGTCPGMCPAPEFALRLRQRRLHRLELGPPPSRRPDPRLAVKEYSRPAAGKPPPRAEELRPPPVLLSTVRHLLAVYAAGEAAEEAECCAFVTDRLRAVRLDLTLQRLAGQPCTAPVLERGLAFLLHAGQRLQGRAGARFDPHLHRAQVQESFAALRGAYREGREQGRAAPAEPRFQALFLLYNLGSPDALRETLLLPEAVRRSPEVALALALHWAFRERNAARLFRLARLALPDWARPALQRHLPEARRQALAAFCHGFHSARSNNGGHGVPLEALARMLGLGGAEEAAAGLCRAHGLSVTAGGGVVFRKGAFKEREGAEPQQCLPCASLEGAGEGKEALPDVAERLCS